MRNAMLFIVAGQMGEELDELYKKHTNGYLHTVKCRGGLETKAVMEGVELMATKNLMEAIMCLMASFYIFNVDYPPKMRRTLLFYQLEVLKIVGDGDRKDNIMKAFYAKLIK